MYAAVLACMLRELDIMRHVLLTIATALLGLMLIGATKPGPNPGACGGFTIHGEPCCVSGTVTLRGAPVDGALVTAYLETRGRKASDVTGLAVPTDPYPTFGILLNGEELQAQPGDTVSLTVRYKAWSRTVEFTVQQGEQWLEIELDSVARDSQSAR